jgi:catechol 2,3-dioxygenase-like lactoylglutathione lyase family enzyme
MKLEPVHLDALRSVLVHHYNVPLRRVVGATLESSPMQVIGLDHVVLTVGDVERSLSWYTGVLGLAPTRVEEWRQGEAPFPSIRVNEATIIDLIPHHGPAGGQNMDHFCLVVAAIDLVAWAAASGQEIIDGPGPRFGARGVATSIYIRDPDGNTVELRHYP